MPPKGLHYALLWSVRLSVLCLRFSWSRKAVVET